MRVNIAQRRCTVCGRRPFGTVEVSMLGEITCVHHPVACRCAFCGRPHDRCPPPGWGTFGSLLRCTTCLAGAIETQADARRLLPAIRRDMADIGIMLPTRVLVRLVEPDDLDPGRQPTAGFIVVGVTEHVSFGGGPATVVEIRIARGQPPLQFGRAVAHEMGHAWIVQHGAREPEHVVEEGLCELFAHAWLKRQRDAVADELRRRLRDNPDPIYGAGFRLVHAAVTRHGIAAVLDSLTRRGTLPG